MSNRRCPTCGEEYSDTYRSCPFCEEEAAIRRGHPPRRRGGRRTEKRTSSSGGAGGIMLLLSVLVILGVVVYVFFGDDLAGAVGIRTDPKPVGAQVEKEDPPAEPAPPENPDPAGETEPDDPASESVVSPATPPEPPAEPVPLALNQTNITIRVGDKGRLDYAGGAGEVTWTSSNDQIASVEGGTITGLAGGTVTITATSGEETATCEVKVEGDPWVNPNVDTSKIRLNKTDFTFGKDEISPKLKVKGTESPVTWASNNTSVATVDENGVVKWVGKGTTTVTATVDGVTLECIVRAK